MLQKNPPGLEFLKSAMKANLHRNPEIEKLAGFTRVFVQKASPDLYIMCVSSARSYLQRLKIARCGAYAFMSTSRLGESDAAKGEYVALLYFAVLCP